MNKSASFTIGKVTGVHGLKGYLKVWSFAQSIDTFSPGRNVLLKSGDGQEKYYTILAVSNHKKGILLSLDGVDQRKLAEDLVGKEILMNRDQLPEPDKGEWYWNDLIGLDVFDHQKGFIGKITKIFPTGANDILVIRDEAQETLVPMHRQFVESIDIEKNILVTTLPEGY